MTEEEHTDDGDVFLEMISSVLLRGEVLAEKIRAAKALIASHEALAGIDNLPPISVADGTNVAHGDLLAAIELAGEQVRGDLSGLAIAQIVLLNDLVQFIEPSITVEQPGGEA